MIQITKHQKRKYWNTYFADFETVTPNTNWYRKHKDTRVLAWGMQDIDGNYLCGTQIQEFLDTIFEKCREPINYIYFHNLSFDGTFMLKHIVKNKFKPSRYQVLGENEFYVFRNGKTIYKLEIRHNYKTYIFKCSYKLFSASISALGESFGIEKHKESDGASFYDLEPKKSIYEYKKRFREYLENDVTVMRYTFITFDNLLKKYTDHLRQQSVSLNDYTTTGSLTRYLMEQYAKQYNPSIDYLHIDSQVLKNDEYDGFYAGGLSQINTEYTFQLFQEYQLNNAVMIDINSAYPFQMTKALPYGPPMEKKENPTDVKLMRLHIHKAVIKDKYRESPFLKNWNKSIKDDIRYVKDMRNKDVVYWDCEWETLLKFYDIEYDLIKSWYFQTAPYLKDYMEMLYADKSHFKESKQAGLTLMVKILLNSCYGALAMGNDYATSIYTNNVTNWNQNNIVKYRGQEYRVKRESELFNINPKYTKLYICDELSAKKESYNKFAASYVTALERSYLMEKVKLLKDSSPKSKFLLCDTDSILINNLSDEMLKQIYDEQSPKLGDWDVENKKPVKWFKTFGVKKYVLLDENKQELKTRFAGINPKVFKRIENIRWDEQDIHFENGTLTQEYTESGIVLIWKEKNIKRGTH